MLDLFADAEPWQEPLAAGAVILHRFAFNAAEQLIRDINDVASQSPFRQMVTPGGYTMSVAMTPRSQLLSAAVISGEDETAARLSNERNRIRSVCSER